MRPAAWSTDPGELWSAGETPDPQRSGRGWHVVTGYQREQLRALLDDLELVLAPVG